MFAIFAVVKHTKKSMFTTIVIASVSIISRLNTNMRSSLSSPSPLSSSSSDHCHLVAALGLVAATAKANAAASASAAPIKTRVPRHQLACPVYPWQAFGETRERRWRTTGGAKTASNTRAVTDQKRTPALRTYYQAEYKLQKMENCKKNRICCLRQARQC